MPHVSLEYSANLEPQLDMQALCQAIHGAMLATGLFEIGAIRVRALRADAFAIADLDARNGFIDICVRIGRGRSPADRKRLGEAVNAAAKAELAPFLAEPHFALSLEVREIDPDLSWKTNAMHPRLRRDGKAE